MRKLIVLVPALFTAAQAHAGTDTLVNFMATSLFSIQPTTLRLPT